ncbi:hypothetical protein BS50DRAFT_656421 [Corynespora cassiicola Philippines]|uniref:Uncharacterized protein n=1 Tax=Corynespora cassiicola Philippines TaxID=1448308 RepID=A0A2T2N331_CORCC|nr:hypothetical protein BS50DRAFT_656421 [Corynespora cassiicola Philippines]
MPINWQDKETNDRLLAAIIAANDMSINCKEVARYFGPDATYNAIENFLRKPKKLAQQLKKEASAAGFSGPAKSPVRPRNPSTPNTPKSAAGTPAKAKSTLSKKGTAGGGGVMSGRVGKAGSKKSTTKIKEEIKDEGHGVLNDEVNDEVNDGLDEIQTDTFLNGEVQDVI